MIGWIYHVSRKVWIFCSSMEGEIFIYSENNYRNFELSTEEWIRDLKKKWKFDSEAPTGKTREKVD